jgi:predicted transcriptional regulator
MQGGAVRGFGELEAAVMQRLWNRAEPATVRDVLTDLVRERELAYTTVLTVMEKLFRKGWLGRESQGRAHVYRALVSREEYTAGLMREALTDSGDREQALLHFVGQMTLAEAAALRSALSSYERKISGR